MFYFANAFDTSTRGFDIIVTTDYDWGTAGTTDFLASINYNEIEITGGDVDSFLNAEDQFDFENLSPNWRGVFSATHRVGNFGLLGRVNYFGPFENSDNGGANGSIQKFSSEVFVDLEASYTAMDKYTFTIGARNVFDEYPDEADDSIGDSCCGRVYLSASEVDWQGGYYYARVKATF